MGIYILQGAGIMKEIEEMRSKEIETVSIDGMEYQRLNVVR